MFTTSQWSHSLFFPSASVIINVKSSSSFAFFQSIFGRFRTWSGVNWFPNVVTPQSKTTWSCASGGFVKISSTIFDVLNFSSTFCAKNKSTFRTRSKAMTVKWWLIVTCATRIMWSIAHRWANINKISRKTLKRKFIKLHIKTLQSIQSWVKKFWNIQARRNYVYIFVVLSREPISWTVVVSSCPTGNSEIKMPDKDKDVDNAIFNIYMVGKLIDVLVVFHSSNYQWRSSPSLIKISIYEPLAFSFYNSSSQRTATNTTKAQWKALERNSWIKSSRKNWKLVLLFKNEFQDCFWNKFWIRVAASMRSRKEESLWISEMYVNSSLDCDTWKMKQSLEMFWATLEIMS